MLKWGFHPNHVRDSESGYFSLRRGTAVTWVFPGEEIPLAMQSLRAALALACSPSKGWEFPRPELGVAATKVVVSFLLFFSSTQPEYQVATEFSIKKETLYFQRSDPGYLKLCSFARSGVRDGKTPVPCVKGFAATSPPRTPKIQGLQRCRSPSQPLLSASLMNTMKTSLLPSWLVQPGFNPA